MQAIRDNFDSLDRKKLLELESILDDHLKGVRELKKKTKKEHKTAIQNSRKAFESGLAEEHLGIVQPRILRLRFFFTATRMRDEANRLMTIQGDLQSGRIDLINFEMELMDQEESVRDTIEESEVARELFLQVIAEQKEQLLADIPFGEAQITVSEAIDMVMEKLKMAENIRTLGITEEEARADMQKVLENSQGTPLHNAVAIALDTTLQSAVNRFFETFDQEDSVLKADVSADLHPFFTSKPSDS